MSNEGLFTLLFIGGVFISSVSQVLLKKSASRHYDSRLQEYMNIKVIAAYSMFFLATLATMLAYKYVNLSMGVVLESTGYVFVTFLGVVFLKEKVTGRKLVGIITIIVGIIVFTIK